MTRKAIGKQLAYLRRDLDAIDSKLSLGKNLPPRHAERLGTIRAVYEQQKYMYDNRTHSVPDRIVSVSQPFVRPIVRGKAGKPVEFGAKLDISVVDGWTRLECCSFDAYNEAGNLREMAERFRAREGHYPSRILADKIYRNRENLSYCKAHGIRLSGPAPGRPKKGETRDKAQDYRDECERVEVERRFSLAKRKCGMGLVTAKLRETAAHVIAMSVLVLNLRKIQRALLRMLAYLLEILAQKKNWALVQWTLIILYEINFTAVQAYLQHRAILYGKLRVPSVQGGVHGKTDVNISPETMLDGSLTLLMLGENQKLENTSTCKNLYRYNSQRPLAGVLLDNVKRMVYPSFKRE